MKIIEKSVADLVPYENNPRNNTFSVDKVAESIKEFGFKVPILIDKNNLQSGLTMTMNCICWM